MLILNYLFTVLVLNIICLLVDVLAEVYIS